MHTFRWLLFLQVRVRVRLVVCARMGAPRQQIIIGRLGAMWCRLANLRRLGNLESQSCSRRNPVGVGCPRQRCKYARMVWVRGATDAISRVTDQAAKCLERQRTELSSPQVLGPEETLWRESPEFSRRLVCIFSTELSAVALVRLSFEHNFAFKGLVHTTRMHI